MGSASFLRSPRGRAALAVLSAAVLGSCCPRQPACPAVVAAPPLEAGRPGQAEAAATGPEDERALVVGLGAVSFEVSEVPGFFLGIEQAGEYQIDGMGTLDALLRVFAEDRLVASDDNGGESHNARVIVFLEQGDYRVVVQDVQGRAMLGQIEVHRLPELEATATLSPGQPVTVQTPSGPTARDATQALALTISTADIYQLDAVAPAGGDAEIAVHSGGAQICRDSDGGEGTNALVRCQLAPGEYQVRVWEYGLGAAAIRVSVDRAAEVAARPLPPVQQAGRLAIGRPLVVRVPATEDPVAGTRGLAFTVAEAGVYRLDAVAPQDVDAEIALVRDGRMLQVDSDSGGDLNAQLTLDLTPGRYEVRVWEFGHRGGAITVTAARP